MSNLALQSEGSRSTDCPACPGKPVLERIEARAAQTTVTQGGVA